MSRTKIGVAVVELESGKVLQTFQSYHDCASFLAVTHPAVSYRIKKENSFIADQFGNKKVYLKKSDITEVNGVINEE